MKIRKKKREKEYLEDEFGTLTPTQERVFDQFERVIWEQHLYPSGDILFESEYEYNKEFLIREKSWNENGEWTEIHYEYNEEGILIFRETIDYQGNKEIMKNILSRDKETLEFYDNEAYLYKKEEAYFNTKRQATKRIFFDNGEIQEKHDYEYDRNGNIIKRTVRFKNDLEEFQISFFHYEYDNNHNVIFEAEKNFDKTIRYQKESQFENDLLVKEIENGFEGSNETIITLYEYDIDQRLVKITIGNKEGKPKRQELMVYNEDESVIKIFTHEQSYSFDRPPTKSQIRREISYYD